MIDGSQPSWPLPAYSVERVVLLPGNAFFRVAQLTVQFKKTTSVNLFFDTCKSVSKQRTLHLLEIRASLLGSLGPADSRNVLCQLAHFCFKLPVIAAAIGKNAA